MAGLSLPESHDGDGYGHKNKSSVEPECTKIQGSAEIFDVCLRIGNGITKDLHVVAELKQRISIYFVEYRHWVRWPVIHLRAAPVTSMDTIRRTPLADSVVNSRIAGVSDTVRADMFDDLPVVAPLPGHPAAWVDAGSVKAAVAGAFLFDVMPKNGAGFQDSLFTFTMVTKPPVAVEELTETVSSFLVAGLLQFLFARQRATPQLFQHYNTLTGRER